MDQKLKPSGAGDQPSSHATGSGDRRLEQLVDRLPQRFRSTVRWLRRPAFVWVRMPAGVLLVCGGILGFLPILGFWMTPLGLALLADDVPPLRLLRSRILNWIERRYPHWLAASPHLPDSSA